MKTDNTQPPKIIFPLGKALKDARLASQLSVDEVAEKLNLGPCTVRDLEDELEDVLATNKYPVIYLRGYLANYAKLVGLTTLELFAEYQQLENIPKNKPTLQHSNLIIAPRKKRSKLLPISLLLIVVIAALVYLLQQPLLATLNQYIPSVVPVADSSDKVANVQKIELSLPVIAKVSQSETTESEDATIDTVGETVVTEEVIISEQEPPSEALTEVKQIEPIVIEQVQPEVATSEVEVLAVSVETDKTTEPEASFDAFEAQSSARESEEVTEQVVDKVEQPTGPENLMLAFNAECWTEVFDASGKRIAFGLYKNGRVLTLSGIAPFQLKLGDPSVVEIQYQDQIIEGEFTPGRSAQFSVPLS